LNRDAYLFSFARGACQANCNHIGMIANHVVARNRRSHQAVRQWRPRAGRLMSRPYNMRRRTSCELNEFGRGERHEPSPFCSRHHRHNRCICCMGNRLGRTTQEGDCLANPGRSALVYAALLHDGRQRAQLFGDSSQGGAWIDRVRIPGGARVLAHTHAQDELVTVIEGSWYLGEGAKFDSTKLKGYPAGSFIVIPAGIPHFVAAREGTVVVQLNGIGKFQTNYLEK
jgi:quercetin dioxygenase-like cupin family protein